MEIEFGNGKNMLYRYLISDVMKKRHGDHPDPLFEEYTYGDGDKYGNMIRNNVELGSHIFFHTTIGNQRYITAHYYVSRVMEGYDARHDDEIRKKFNNIHIHPENYPDWWIDYNVDSEEEGNSSDVIIFGHPDKSLGELTNPIPFDRDFGEKLEFENKKIKFEIVNKNGRVMNDAECISSCTRVPRYLTKNDVKFLINEINSLNGGEKIDSEHESGSIGNEDFFSIEEDEQCISDESFEEKKVLRHHEFVERNSKLAKRTKEIHGYTCVACGFNFRKKYGEIGMNYIEAHHLTPFADLNEKSKVSPKNDMTVLCANCHRMIHRLQNVSNIEEFKKTIH